MTRRITDELVAMGWPTCSSWMANIPDGNKTHRNVPPEDYSIWDLMSDEWLSEEMAADEEKVGHPEWYICGPEDL